MKPLFFDLDGTLIDSKLDIANSVNASLIHFRLEPIKNETIYEFVGNGVKQLLVDCLNQHGKINILDEFFTYFLKTYYKHLLDNTTVYEGVFNTLNEIKKTYELFIVTNKSELFAKKVVAGLGLSPYFKDMAGGDTYKNKKPHPEQILKLIKKHNLNIEGCYFVGDSENDIIAAQSVGLKIIWASYGFRGRDILKKHTVDFIIDYPEQLLEILLNNENTD